uniref:Uncharacterized protein n=1 Tax=uncultured Helicobacter sp. TaxID=175537 RepID=A0A650EMP5_9HELI|nr:hypothetical protein Helico5904_1000 [uncultured Helicobacter sp.]
MWQNIPEEELKNKIAQEYFKDFDTTRILGKIDFCVSHKSKDGIQSINFLWAEAKRGSKSDIIESFVQLILTIGKKRTFEAELPPLFLGAFDCEKIAFIPYHAIIDIFNQNDFNWNVTPSNHQSKEFKQLYATSKKLLESEKLQFDFTRDSKELKGFIKTNFSLENKNVHKIQITQNNFIHIYYKWLEKVAPTIGIDWDKEKPDILSADFYLADLLSENNETKKIKESLRVLLQSDYYKVKLEKRANNASFNFTEFNFNDNQKAHLAFWNLYERPPIKEYWDYLIERRDLLVPVDIRERKGAFFTPQIWVRKAQDYLAKALGEDWQSEYIVWDCAAGTGNLLVGLSVDKYKIYASTLDKADVDIMRDKYGNQSLLESHIFQFDFLNDILFDIPCKRHKGVNGGGADEICKDCQKSKIPKSLQEILKNEKKREKLIIFINPPYAEAGNSKTQSKTGEHKPKVATDNATYEKYKEILGKASNELFAQFFIRIYREILHCTLASFSTLKYVNSSNFVKFRETFSAKFLRGFAVPAFTFDNVNGQFPIGFLVWDLSQKVKFRKINLEVFEKGGEFIGKKSFYRQAPKTKTINHWLREHRGEGETLGILMADAPDFQQQNHIAILNNSGNAHLIFQNITADNLLFIAIYFAVRHAIPATWLNDRDQFLYPNDLWQQDSSFQNDCLAFMLFHGQNKITSQEGVNHFIPFSVSEVVTKEVFASNFMHDFINGKIKPDSPCDTQSSPCHSTQSEKSPKESKRCFANVQHDKSSKKGQTSFEDESFYVIPTKPLNFSDEAKAVFKAGRELWAYYHAQEFKDSKNPYNANASLYDIKVHFQGFNDKGKMNPPQKAQDSHYKDFIGNLNYELKILAKKIEPKIYEYGFLLE